MLVIFPLSIPSIVILVVFGLCSVISQPAKNNCSIANIILYVLFFLFYFFANQHQSYPSIVLLCFFCAVCRNSIFKCFLCENYYSSVKKSKAYIDRLNLVETFLSKIIVNGREVRIGQEKKHNPYPTITIFGL